MTALYSTYRPKTFEDVVGQEHITLTLRRSLQDSISHAYILSGSRGTGKTTVARLIAASVNCQTASLACGKCEGCLSVIGGTHPDIIEIDAASNRGIADIKALRDRVNYMPVSGKFKVYILDEAHMLTNEASNALLKTLEEPPKHVIFILATTEITKVLPTIRSRCQPFAFRLVQMADIFKRLEQINALEGFGIPRASLQFIAEEAKGSIRDGISLMEVISRLDSKDIDRVRYLTGRMEFSRVGDFVECLRERSIPKAINFINDVYRDENVDMMLLKQDVVAWLRSLTYVAVGAKTFNHPMLERMQRQALDFNVKDLAICIRKFNYAENESCAFIPQLDMELPAIDSILEMSEVEDF